MKNHCIANPTLFRHLVGGCLEVARRIVSVQKDDVDEDDQETSGADSHLMMMTRSVVELSWWIHLNNG